MKYILSIIFVFSLLSIAMATDFPKSSAHLHAAMVRLDIQAYSGKITEEDYKKQKEKLLLPPTTSMVEARKEYERTLASPTKEFYEAIPVVPEIDDEEVFEPKRKKSSVTDELIPRRGGTIPKPPKVSFVTPKKMVPPLTLPPSIMHDLVQEESSTFSPLETLLDIPPSLKVSPLSKKEQKTIYDGT